MARRILPLWLFVFLLIFFACDGEKEQQEHSEQVLSSVVSRGNTKALGAHTISKKAVSLRPREVPCGTPSVVFAHKNIEPCKTPIAIAIKPDELWYVKPGSKGVPQPVAFQVTDSSFVCPLPVPAPALPFAARDAASYHIHNLDVDQGMNSSYITAVFEDENGVMWFGTDGGGVSRYNGYSFLHFTVAEGLVNNNVKTILKDRDGNLWFGTWGGITKYDGTRFTNYDQKHGLKHPNIRAMAQDQAGNLWIGTYSGLLKFDGKQFTEFSTREGLSGNNVGSLCVDKKGQVWIGTNQGLNCYDGSGFRQYRDAYGQLSDTITAIAEDRDGNLWLGTPSGLCKFDKQAVSRFHEWHGLGNVFVRSITIDRKGHVWVGTFGSGLFRFDGATFTHIGDEEGLSDNYILSGYEDEVGNLWFGTFGGVNKFNPNSFVHFTERQGLLDKHVLCIYEDRKGQIWFGTLKGVCKYDGVTYTYYTISEGLSDNCVWSIGEDAKGSMWFATNAGGVCEFTGTSFKHYTRSEGFFTNTVFSIWRDSRDSLWFGTNAGLVLYDGKGFRQYTVNDSLPNNNVWVIREDRSRNLWLGTWNGAAMFDGKKIVHYTTKEGLPDNSVRTILEDKAGRLWFGTEQGGLACYDHERFLYVNQSHGLSSNAIWSACTDHNGNLWFGTDKGLNRLREQPFRDISKRFHIEIFHKRDGLKAEDFFQNAMLFDKNHHLWFGTGKALTRLNAYDFCNTGAAGPVQLDLLTLQDRYVDFHFFQQNKPNGFNSADWMNQLQFSNVPRFKNYPENLVAPYHVNHFVFYFGATDWREPHNLRYQYQLENLEEDWSLPSAENKADYKNIPPGHYRFMVRARSSNGNWTQPTVYPFTITPPWWKTTWAMCIGFLLLCLCCVGIVWLYSRNLKQRADELKIKVEDATREIIRQKNLIEEKHLEITDSINYAERIQKSFLASKELLDKQLAAYFVLYLPKAVVSGDFYWANEFRNGKFAVAVADSTGHGVPGAIMSLLNINSLERAAELSQNPAHILNISRQFIIERLKKDGSPEGGRDGMDISLLMFDAEKRSFSFSAANNSIWVIRGSEFIELPADKMPVGKHEHDHLPFQQKEFVLQKDDLIYCFTDGIKDQFGGSKGKKYKCSGLKQFLLSISTYDMDEQKRCIYEEFVSWKGELEQVDDVTILGIRVT